MTEETKSQEFNLNKTDETKSWKLSGKNKQSELMSKKYNEICTSLNHIKHFLVLASKITECISMSTFASFFGITIEIDRFCSRI